jgi:hypothetical protein
MSLTTISYSEASRIVDLYSKILTQSERLSLYKKFRYSELNGYDVFDIDNALKICSAYRVYKTEILDDNSIEKLKKDSSIDGGACMSFFSLFAPDNIAQQLNNLDYHKDRNEIYNLDIDFSETDLWKAFSKSETHDSFLEFCLSIEKTDINYWEKVYSRLGIIWDERDEYDPIYNVLLNKGESFKDHIIAPKKDAPEEKLKIENSESSSSFYTRNKTIIGKFAWTIVFCSGFFYPPVRVVLFGLFLLIGAFQLYFWVKEPIENKLNFALHILYWLLLPRRYYI